MSLPQPQSGVKKARRRNEGQNAIRRHYSVVPAVKYTAKESQRGRAVTHAPAQRDEPKVEADSYSAPARNYQSKTIGDDVELFS